MHGAGPSYPSHECGRLLADCSQPAMPAPPHAHIHAHSPRPHHAPVVRTVPTLPTPLHALLSNTNDASLRQCITPRATIKPPLSHACCKKKDAHHNSCNVSPERAWRFPPPRLTRVCLCGTAHAPRVSAVVILLQALVKPRRRHHHHRLDHHRHQDKYLPFCSSSG